MSIRLLAAAGLAAALGLSDVHAQDPKPAAEWWTPARAQEKGWAVKLEGERVLVCSAERCAWLELDDPRVRRTQAGLQVDGAALSEMFAKDAGSEAPKAALGKGDLLPELFLVDLENEPVRLGAYRGKRLLITAWASW